MFGLYLKRAKLRRHDGLSSVLEKHGLGTGDEGGDPGSWLTLLCYEDRYPAFGAILEKIAPHFPVHTFSPNPEFRSALELLNRLSLGNERDRRSIRLRECGALATLTRVIIDDPAVQIRYGMELQGMVDALLGEIQEASRDQGEASLSERPQEPP